MQSIKNLAELRCEGHLIGKLPPYKFWVMINVFGEDVPLSGDGYKTTREWTVDYIKDGVKVATFNIYDYRGSKWHIGGTDQDSKYVAEFISFVNEQVIKP